MKKIKIIIILIFAFLFMSCNGKVKKYNIDKSKPYLKILISFDSSSYPWLMGKKYPQMALWLKNKATGKLKTIFVTGSAGKNKWSFADSRPESIPVWYGILKKENKAGIEIDSITGATPSGKAYNIFWHIPERFKSDKWELYLEANVSYDYNDYYSKSLKKGDKGFSGENGQPSIIWTASIDLSSTSPYSVIPKIKGHGDILGKNHKIIKDISKISTAKSLFKYIKIVYTPGK